MRWLPRTARNFSPESRSFRLRNKSGCRFSAGATNVEPNHPQIMEQAILRAESHNNVLPFTLREDARDATLLIIPSPSFEVLEESPFRETTEEQPRKPFIEANTKAVTLSHLQNDCITPVFSKDNEVTISHNQFIETTWECAQRMFRSCTVEEPEIRVSHIVKGRTPEAIHKAVKDRTDEDKTIYYERMMFCIEIPAVTETIDGCRLNLTVGGVRAYNQENLYSKKGFEKFKVFIGFKNMVCCNRCVASCGRPRSVWPGRGG